MAQYHLHPESKFHNGDYIDRGFTHRRHIRAMATEYIGKEANRWEEQLHLGLDLEAQTAYGLSPEGRERALQAAREVADAHGQRQLAAAAGVSLSEASAVLLRKHRPTPAMLAKLYSAIPRLERNTSEEAEQVWEVLEAVKRRCDLLGIRQFAKRSGVDSSNLAKILSGRRKPSRVMLTKLKAALYITP